MAAHHQVDFDWATDAPLFPTPVALAPLGHEGFTVFASRFAALPVASLLFVSGLPDAALASWPHEPTINLPVCTASGEQFLSGFISDGAGGAFATWQDYRAGNSDVYAQHILASGIVDPAWPANGRAVCTLTSNQFNPVVVADGLGGIIVIWSDFRSGVAFDIYAQHVLANGQIDPAWPATQLPVCTATNDQTMPLAVSDGQGGAVVTWQDNRAVTDLYAQRIRLSGSVDPAWPVNGRAVCTAGGIQIAHSVVSDGAGGVIVAWQDARGASYDIFAQRMLVSGIVDPAWPANGVAVCAAGGDQISVTCAPDGAGGAIIAWDDERFVGDHDIYAHHVKSTGIVDVNWDANGRLVVFDTAQQTAPCIATDGAGGAFVAWQDGRENKIYATRVLANGIPDPAWTTNGVPLAPASGTQVDPACAADGSGGAFVGWTDDRGNTNLYAQHLWSSQLDAYWPYFGRAVSTQAYSRENPFIVSDGRGGAILGWNDLRSSVRDLYAQRIAPFGRLGNPEGNLLSIRDVPNDQGGQVLLEWSASYLDGPSSDAIGQYSVWRRVATAPMRTSGATAISNPRRWREVRYGLATTYWEWIAEQPARGRPGYSCVVPTTSDSNSWANPLTEFMVSAEMAAGLPYWDSASLSGYSVDNLPPATPSPFTGQYAAGTASLQWGANHEPDFLEYRLYRGRYPGFEPYPVTLVSSQSGTGYADAAGSGFYYKLAAVDIHGNVSAYALLLPEGATVDVPRNPTPAFALSAPTPNPARDWTELRLTLPRAARVSLTLLDPAGRNVRTVLSDDLGQGEHAMRVTLRSEDGRALATGLYFLRLETGSIVRTSRLAIIR